MIQILIDTLQDTRLMAMMFAAVAAIATVLTLAMPLLANDALEKRMKSVALEREKIRQRERERLAQSDKVSLRQSPTAIYAGGRQPLQPQQMARPGRSARQADPGRLSRPGALRHLPVLPAGDRRHRWYRRRLSTFSSWASSTSRLRSRLGILLIAAYLGMQLPYILLKNKIQKRQTEHQARLSRCARSAADLRGIRHVD